MSAGTMIVRRPALVVIGNFDGIHRGHQVVLTAAQRLASERNLRTVMLTFEPHPAIVLGRPAPARLTSSAMKRRLSQRACPGIEVVAWPFDRAFAALSAAQFVERVLVQELGAAVVMVGQDFRFGRGREAGLQELQQLGAQHGFEAIAQPLERDAEGAWSSSRVRRLLAAGEVEAAAHILARPHALSGRVVPGDQRGRTIGFPTCNIAATVETWPAHGVYAVLVDRLGASADVSEEEAAELAIEGCALDEGRALATGIANLGIRPTVAGELARPLLEVHLFGVAEDLYGACLRVSLMFRLRGERRFADLDALKGQIERDCAAARKGLERWKLPERGPWGGQGA